MTQCNSTNPDVSKYTDFNTALESLPLDSTAQKGGSIGFNLRVENPTIGGLAEVKGYNNQPELREGQFVEGTDACDAGEMTGGRRKRNRKSRRNRKLRRNRKSRRNSKSKRNTKYRRNTKSKRNINKKSRRNTKSKKRINLKGGMAHMNEAFNGSESIYTPKMDFRSFDCKQPVWEPKCA